MNTSKKFYRSRKNRVVAGIMGGIGEYFVIDPLLVRIIFFLFIVGTGFFPGALAYLIIALVTPEEPVSMSEKSASATDDDTEV
ncbi:PspC domain-containing protein [soil metagenome]